MPKTWLITGTSRGLGRALAEAVAASGDRLVATARDPDTLAELANRYPDQIVAVTLDVTDRARGQAAVRATVEQLGRLDVLVNNAGYANVNSIEDFTEDDFRAQLETNLWGVINLSRAAVPVMRRQGSGHIIQMSSVGGRLSSPGLGPYQTAKWGVEGFSGVLAAEVAPLGIHVTLIEPGGFDTDWSGASMTVHDVREDYRPTVGAMARRRESRDTFIGDPRKAARAIMRVAAMPDPPLRLLLGSDAYRAARIADEQRIAADEAWRELTVSTDR
jgi:NAD(P)-dependent dehydrogenase (short-subunit alcohol dehydrogenase family)